MSGWYDNGRVYHIELSLQAVSPPAGDEIVVDKKARGPFPRNVGSYRLGTSVEGRERELSLCTSPLKISSNGGSSCSRGYTALRRGAGEREGSGDPAPINVPRPPPPQPSHKKWFCCCWWCCACCWWATWSMWRVCSRRRCCSSPGSTSGLVGV